MKVFFPTLLLSVALFANALPTGLTCKFALVHPGPYLRLHYLVHGKRHDDYGVEQKPGASNLSGASRSCRFYRAALKRDAGPPGASCVRARAAVRTKKLLPAGSACRMIPNESPTGPGV